MPKGNSNASTAEVPVLGLRRRETLDPETVPPTGGDAYAQSDAAGAALASMVATARTNVVPVVAPPSEQVLHAFSYAVPVSSGRSERSEGAGGGPTFVSSGAPEAQAMWDSTSGVDERLLNGELAQMVVSDPPYNVKGLRGIEWVSLGSEGPRKLCIS